MEGQARRQHEKRGRSSAEHSAVQSTPAPNPLISVAITTAGKRVMNWTPTTYGSMASRSAVATPAHRKARAYAPAVPGRGAGHQCKLKPAFASVGLS